MAEKIRVLVVDDSALIRNMVGRFFASTQDVEVVGKAVDGAFALKKLETLHPDLVILDLEMPQMNGIQFLEERRRRGIETPVIILSSLARKGARITMEALALGAADFVLKPSGESGDLERTRDQLLQLVRAYGGRRPEEAGFQEPPPAAAPPAEPLPRPPAGRIEVVAIGISTGGPSALRRMIPLLEAGLPPLLVVQHMPAGFIEEFALSLDKSSPLEIREARDGDLIRSGRVLIAPGDRHLTIEELPLARVVRLSEAAPVNGHRPSADVLFSEVARVYGGHALAVIMTGMGRDGAEQIGAVYRLGGITLAQDQRSSVVFGMPRAAIERGHIHRVVPLPQMAETINSYCRGPASQGVSSSPPQDTPPGSRAPS